MTPDAYRSEELELIEVKVLWRSAYFLADDIPPTKVLEFLDNLSWQAGLTSTPQKYFEWDRSVILMRHPWLVLICVLSYLGGGWHI